MLLLLQMHIKHYHLICCIETASVLWIILLILCLYGILLAILVQVFTFHFDVYVFGIRCF